MSQSGEGRHFSFVPCVGGDANPLSVPVSLTHCTFLSLPCARPLSPSCRPASHSVPRLLSLSLSLYGSSFVYMLPTLLRVSGVGGHFGASSLLRIRRINHPFLLSHLRHVGSPTEVPRAMHPRRGSCIQHPAEFPTERIPNYSRTKAMYSRVA